MGILQVRHFTLVESVRILVVALLTVAVFPGSAAAGTRVGVMVVAQDVFSEPAAALMEQLGSQQIMGVGDNTVVESWEHLLKGLPGKGQADFRSARDDLRRGEEAYGSLDLEKAAEILSAAIEKLENLASELDRDREGTLAKALAFLGTTLVLEGEPEKGQEVFRRLLVLNRHAQLDPAVFPPSIRENFEALRKEVVAGPMGTISVSSAPVCGKAFVDGVFAGITPVTVGNLPAGEHLVAVRSSGFEPCGKTVVVGGFEERPVHCNLADLPGAEEQKKVLEDASRELSSDAPLPGPLREFLGSSAPDQLVFGRVIRRGQEVQYHLVLFDVRSGTPVREQVGIWREDAKNFTQAVEGVFSNLFTGREDLSGSKLVGPALKPWPGPERGLFSSGGQPPFYERWYFWVAVGAGVVVTTILLAFVLSPEQEPKSQILLEFW